MSLERIQKKGSFGYDSIVSDTTNSDHTVFRTDGGLLYRYVSAPTSIAPPAAILESWRKPFLVLATVPMALIGVLWALRLGKLNVSIFVLLGAVMLIGVVVNPAVLIVDKASQLEKTGEGKAVAMCHAVAATFRAVVMVIIASGLGMLPIALSTGIGAVNRIGIGAASVGGILIAGALTLLVLPFVTMALSRRK